MMGHLERELMNGISIASMHEHYHVVLIYEPTGKMAYEIHKGSNLGSPSFRGSNTSYIGTRKCSKIRKHLKKICANYPRLVTTLTCSEHDVPCRWGGRICVFIVSDTLELCGRFENQRLPWFAVTSFPLPDRNHPKPLRVANLHPQPKDFELLEVAEPESECIGRIAS